MRWGPYETCKDAIFFGEYSNNTVIGLSGSRKHLITSGHSAKVGDFFGGTFASEPPYIEEIFRNEVKRAEREISEEKEYRIPVYPGEKKVILLTDKFASPHILDETQWIVSSMEGLTEQVEFLALKLVEGTVSFNESWAAKHPPDRGWGRDLLGGQKRVLIGSPIYVARASEH